MIHETFKIIVISIFHLSRCTWISRDENRVYTKIESWSFVCYVDLSVWSRRYSTVTDRKGCYRNIPSSMGLNTDMCCALLHVARLSRGYVQGLLHPPTTIRTMHAGSAIFLDVREYNNRCRLVGATTRQTCNILRPVLVRPQQSSITIGIIFHPSATLAALANGQQIILFRHHFSVSSVILSSACKIRILQIVVHLNN